MRIITENALVLLLGCLVVSCGPGPEPVSAEAAAIPRPEGRVLFDDLDYADQTAMGQNGWTIRTAPGIPGIAGATWWTEGVSFVDDESEPGNRLLLAQTYLSLTFRTVGLLRRRS